jgi:hypothetical protein
MWKFHGEENLKIPNNEYCYQMLIWALYSSAAGWVVRNHHFCPKGLGAVPVDFLRLFATSTAPNSYPVPQGFFYPYTPNNSFLTHLSKPGIWVLIAPGLHLL